VTKVSSLIKLAIVVLNERLNSLMSNFKNILDSCVGAVEWKDWLADGGSQPGVNPNPEDESLPADPGIA
jgi:hypothetical protein